MEGRTTCVHGRGTVPKSRPWPFSVHDWKKQPDNNEQKRQGAKYFIWNRLRHWTYCNYYHEERGYFLLWMNKNMCCLRSHQWQWIRRAVESTATPPNGCDCNTTSPKHTHFERKTCTALKCGKKYISTETWHGDYLYYNQLIEEDVYRFLFRVKCLRELLFYVDGSINRLWMKSVLCNTHSGQSSTCKLQNNVIKFTIDCDTTKTTCQFYGIVLKCAI